MLANGAHFTRKSCRHEIELMGGETRPMNGLRSGNAQFVGIPAFDLIMNYD
jgi:hypothetical protein